MSSVRPLLAVPALLVILYILWDGFETIVLPRRVTRKVRLARLFYRTSWTLWSAVARGLGDGKRRETYLSVFGPMSLFLLFALWDVSLMVCFGVLHYVAGEGSLWGSMYMSGTSFFTLGSDAPKTPMGKVVSVAEGGIGMAFLALVISYLPVMYQSFSRRESVISQLDARAGSPAAAVELLRRHGRARATYDLPALLLSWEHWASELLESHVSYPVLMYFRSLHDNQSWLATLTTMLDTCALVILSIEGEAAWQAQLTFAMARHAVVDLAQILRANPIPPAPDRLPAEDCRQMHEILSKANIAIAGTPESAAKLAELRAMYEPFVNSIAHYLLLRLPPWLKSDHLDNWRTSAWGRLSSTRSVLPLGDVDEEHR